MNILITGASSGVGAGLAEVLAKAGHKLMLVARSSARLEQIVGTITKNGGTASYQVVDIRQPKAAAKAVEKTLEAWGKIDVLINNAGLGHFKPVEEITLDEWDEMMEVNVRGTFLFSKAVIPHFKEQKRGFILSVLSDVSTRPIASGSGYVASKFAQEGFTASMRKELRPYGIRVSNVYPGLIDTAFHPPENAERQGWLQPGDVALAIKQILETPAHVVMDELVIHPGNQDY